MMKNNTPYENYTPKQLLELSSELYEQEKYEEVIEILENISDYVSKDNEDEDDMISLIFTLALSYDKLGDELEETIYCEKLIVLLNHFKELLDASFLWNYLIGKANYILDNLEEAIFYLEKSYGLKPDDVESRIYLANAYRLSDQEGKALYYYKQLLELDEDNEILIERINLCLNKLSMPSFEEPFKQRVERAWKLFEEQEETIRQMIDEIDLLSDERKAEQIFYEKVWTKLHNILTIAIENPYFECCTENGIYKLYLSPMGFYFRIPLYSYIRNKMPNSLKKYWSVEVGLPIKNNPKMSDQDLVIDGKEFSIWVEEKEERLFVSVFSEKLATRIKENEYRVYALMLKLLAETIGEIAVARLKEIENVRFELLSQPIKTKPSTLLGLFSREKCPSTTQFITLFELKETLEKKGYVVSNSLEEYLQLEYHYECDPEEISSDNWEFRDDTMYGESKMPAIEFAYEDKETLFFDTFYGMGVITGFFSLPVESFVHNDMVSGDQLEELENNLVKYIEENAGTDVITIFGRAVGMCCIYIDFFAWDINEVLRTAHDFFEQTDLEWVNYHSYRADTTLVKLYRK